MEINSAVFCVKYEVYRIYCVQIHVFVQNLVIYSLFGNSLIDQSGILPYRDSPDRGRYKYKKNSQKHAKNTPSGRYLRLGSNAFYIVLPWQRYVTLHYLDINIS